jgi:hypothetical protein
MSIRMTSVVDVRSRWLREYQRARNGRNRGGVAVLHALHLMPLWMRGEAGAYTMCLTHPSCDGFDVRNWHTQGRSIQAMCARNRYRDFITHDQRRRKGWGPSNRLPR